MSNPLRGTYYIVRGFGLLGKPGIRSFVIIPFLINTLVFTGLIWYSAQHFKSWVDQLVPDSMAWLNFILVPLFTLAMLLISFYVFTIIANIISSPFNGMLAEAVEEYLTGKTPEQTSEDWQKMLKELPQTIGMEIRKLLYFIGWMIPFGLLFLIPGLNIIAPLTWFLFSAWMLAVEYADFPMGNHQIKFTDQRQKLRQKRFMALSLGSTSLMMTMVPILNFLAMPTTVVAATIMWREEYA